MILALKITVSPGSSRTRGCWPAAIRVSALRGLALAAGAEIEHLVARQQLGLALVADRRHVLQVADLARRLDHPAHRAADHEQLAAGGAARPASRSPGARRWRRSWSARRGWAARRSARSGCRAPRPRSPRCRATARWCCRTASRARPPCPSASSASRRRCARRPAAPGRASSRRCAARWPKRRLEHQRVGIGDRVGDVDEAAVERRRP